MLYFFSLFFTHFSSFVQNILNNTSTHVHINKQQGSIHLHQSLNWHILRSCFVYAQNFAQGFTFYVLRFRKMFLFFFHFYIRFFSSFFFFSMNIYVCVLFRLALEEMSTFYLFNTLINIHNGRALGRTGVLFWIHPKCKEAVSKVKLHDPASSNIIHSLYLRLNHENIREKKSWMLTKKCGRLRKYL